MNTTVEYPSKLFDETDDEEDNDTETSNTDATEYNNMKRLNKKEITYPLISTRHHEHLTSIYKVDSQLDFGLQVIGAGLMRSGTTSLKFALEYLYKKQCYHMRELVLNIREPHIKLWLWVIKQDREKKEIPKQFWSYIYNDFVAAVDYPTAGFYKHLSKIYPNAKIILTIRDPDDWVKSCRATTLSETLYTKPSLGNRIIHKLTGLQSLYKLHYRMFQQTLGRCFYKRTDEQLKNIYTNWNEEVIKSIPSDRLLVFDSSQGWKPLCEFLGFPIPPSDIPYPHLNERSIMIQAIDRLQLPGRWIDRFLCICRYLLIPMFTGIIYLRYSEAIYETVLSMIQLHRTRFFPNS
ncbi:unnamed protein product [Schistosoma guineensis]|nr:unnamed protein product [Schistosoma guineensis]